VAVMQTIGAKNEAGDVEAGMQRRLARWRGDKVVQNGYIIMDDTKNPSVAPVADRLLTS
jgi:hypothetical protein